MVLFDVYDFTGQGRFSGNKVEEWKNLTLTYHFFTQLDLSVSLKYVEANNLIIPIDLLGEVFIPEADRYEFIDDDMMSLQSKFQVPLKFGSLNFNHSYNFPFVEGMFFSSRSLIITAFLRLLAKALKHDSIM
mgnify:CR=1 FL=1